MDETGETPEGGLVASLKRVASSVFGLAQTRLELFATELQEEKLRVINLLLWAVLALVLCAAGLLLAIGTLALFLWQVGGYGALIALVAVLLAAATAVLFGLRRRVLRGPAPFAATRSEFRKDAACLRDND